MTASLTLAHFHERIAEKTKDRSTAPVVIVALGDSVTQGVAEVDHLLGAETYHQVLLRLLERQYPLCTFSVINAGVDGSSAEGSLDRLHRDALHHLPDLLIVGFALNDATCGGFEYRETYKAALRTIIERARAETKADILLLTPNMMVTRPNDAVHETHLGLVERFIAVQADGVLPSYAEAIREVGAETGVPVADVYAEWEKMAQAGQDTTAMLSNGLNHPDAERHKLAAETILQKLVGASA
jgi:lysophospholipase L1-like esterase